MKANSDISSFVDFSSLDPIKPKRKNSGFESKYLIIVNDEIPTIYLYQNLNELDKSFCFNILGKGG
jgi:hypothetical protein